MDITGEERIAARREAVWQCLNDPDILKAVHSRLPGGRSGLANGTHGRRQGQDRPGFGDVQRQGHALQPEPARKLYDIG